MDARLKNKLEDQKTEFEREIVQLEQEVQNLKDDVHALEVEALPLYKNWVRMMGIQVFCFQVLIST